MLQRKLKDAWAWYMGLPWWGKLLGVLALIGIALLAILAVVSNFLPSGVDRTASDEKHDDVVDTALEGYEDQRNVIDGIIKAKKKEMASKLNQADKIDADTLVAREKILKAGSVEELLELQKELGL
jgi:hypothetical protein